MPWKKHNRHLKVSNSNGVLICYYFITVYQMCAQKSAIISIGNNINHNAISLSVPTISLIDSTNSGTTVYNKVVLMRANTP